MTESAPEHGADRRSVTSLCAHISRFRSCKYCDRTNKNSDDSSCMRNLHEVFMKKRIGSLVTAAILTAAILKTNETPALTGPVKGRGFSAGLPFLFMRCAFRSFPGAMRSIRQSPRRFLRRGRRPLPSDCSGGSGGRQPRRQRRSMRGCRSC